MVGVDIGGQTTQFQYDADGQRTLVIHPDGTKIYTPFPGYQVEVWSDTAPHVVANIQRSGNSVRLYWTHESQNNTNNGFYVIVAVNGQGSYISNRLREFN